MVGTLHDDLGITDPLKTFHSFRHGFTDALRRAKVEPELRSQLLGHGAGNMTALYGAGHEMKAAKAAIDSVNYS